MEGQTQGHTWGHAGDKLPVGTSTAEPRGFGHRSPQPKGTTLICPGTGAGVALSWQQGDTRDRTRPVPPAPCSHPRRLFFHDLIGKQVPPALAQHSQGSAAPPIHSPGHREGLQWWLEAQLLAGSEPCMDDEGQDTLVHSCAIYRHPFSIISPKESSMANKHMPDATGPGFQSWSGWDMSLQLPNVSPSFPWPPTSRDLGGTGAGTAALLWSEVPRLNPPLGWDTPVCQGKLRHRAGG